MHRQLTSPFSLRKMPLPAKPHAEGHGETETGRPHEVLLFPAVLRSQDVVMAKPLALDGESSCFFHPKLSATAICAISGRFICDLCSTDWKGQTVSLDALRRRLEKDRKSNDDESGIRWDSIALALVFLPILIWPLTLVTAPAALLICIFNLRRAVSAPFRASPLRYIVAGSLALLQVIGWIFLLINIFAG